MEDHKKKPDLQLDTNLEKIQRKVAEIIGALAKVWRTLDAANKSEEEDNPVPGHSSSRIIQFQDMLTGVEQSLTLIGHAFNALSYQ